MTVSTFLTSSVSLRNSFSVSLQILAMGFPSVWAKFKLPYVMMMSLAYLCSAIGWLLNIR